MIGEGRALGEIDGADLAGGKLLAVLAEDLDLADQGTPDGAPMGEPVGGVYDGDAVRLGAGVVFHQDRSPPLDHRRLDVDRAGSGGMDGRT